LEHLLDPVRVEGAVAQVGARGLPGQGQQRRLGGAADGHLPAGAEALLRADDRLRPVRAWREMRGEQLLDALTAAGELPRAGEVQQRAGPARAGVEVVAPHPWSLRAGPSAVAPPRYRRRRVTRRGRTPSTEAARQPEP